MGVLSGRVVIVTGGGRGLGRAHCHELAAQGATVVVNDLGVSLRGESEAEGPSPAEVVAGELRASGATALADTTSVTDWSGMEGLVARTVEEFGDLHAVVNNAGFIRDRVFTSMSEEEFDAVIAVHLKGTFTLTRHACAYWRERGEGRPGTVGPGRDHDLGSRPVRKLRPGQLRLRQGRNHHAHPHRGDRDAALRRHGQFGVPDRGDPDVGDDRAGGSRR